MECYFLRSNKNEKDNRQGNTDKDKLDNFPNGLDGAWASGKQLQSTNW